MYTWEKLIAFKWCGKVLTSNVVLNEMKGCLHAMKWKWKG